MGMGPGKLKRRCLPAMRKQWLHRLIIYFLVHIFGLSHTRVKYIIMSTPNYLPSREAATEQPRYKTPDTTLPPEVLRQIKSTPIAAKVSGSRTYGDLRQCRENRMELCQELSGYFLGPMPLDRFLFEFVPPANDQRRDNPFSRIEYVEGATEASMYEPFVSGTCMSSHLRHKYKVLLNLLGKCSSATDTLPRCGDQ